MDFIDFVEVELRHLKKESLATDKGFADRITGFLDQIIIIKESQIKEKNDRIITHDKILDELFSLLKIIFLINNLRLNLAGLTLLQKTMNIKLMNQKYYQQIVDNLLLLKNKQDLQIQLKMIQTNLNLITPHSIKLQRLQYLTKVYNVSFQIATCKQYMTQRISISGLMQLTELVFNEERFEQYSKNQMNNAFIIVKEFLDYIIVGKQIIWIPNGVNGVVWDLLLEITRYQGHRIRKENHLFENFQKICDSAIKSAFPKYEGQMAKQDFLRFFRCYCHNLIYLKIGHQHISKLNLMKELDKRSFLFSVYLQGLILILPNYVDQYDHSQKLANMLEILVKIADDFYLEHTNLKLNKKKLRVFLESPICLLDKELIGFEDEEAIFRFIKLGLTKLRLSFECNLISERKQNKKQDNFNNYYDNETQLKLKKTLEKISFHIIKIYKILLLVDFDQDESRKFIQQLQLWFLIAARLKLSKLKTRFLEQLAFLTLKIDTKYEIVKCAQALQIMFNLIYGYQEYLDTSSLAIMLRSFQFVQERYYNSKTIKSNNGNNKQWQLEISYELEPKMNMIATLYEKNTIELSQSSLRNTIQALNQITLNLLQELSQMQNPNIYSMRLKSFSVRKMKAVVQNHYKKLRIVWNFIVAHFIYLCSCKSKEIRMHSIDLLSETMCNLVNMKCIQEDNLFEIYFEILMTKYLDIKILVIQKLIQFFTWKGFKIDQKHLVDVIKILKEIECPNQGKKNEEYEKLMELENQLNELIIKECLVNFESEQYMKELIHNYKITSNNKNHEYSRIGLFWVIADHLKKLWQRENEKSQLYKIEDKKDKKYEPKEFNMLQYELLIKLSQLILKNIFHEVRQSGIHSITQIIASNIPLYTLDQLHARFKIYFQLFKKVIFKYKSINNNQQESSQLIEKTVKNEANTNNYDKECTLEKEWYQTSRFFYSNLLKLLKKLHYQKKLTFQQLQEVFAQIRVILNIFVEFKYQMFYFESLQFLLDIKKQISPQAKFLQIQLQINLHLIKQQTELDKKDRINKNKILPIIQELIEIYKKQLKENKKNSVSQNLNNQRSISQ